MEMKSSLTKTYVLAIENIKFHASAHSLYIIVQCMYAHWISEEFIFYSDSAQEEGDGDGPVIMNDAIQIDKGEWVEDEFDASEGQTIRRGRRRYDSSDEEESNKKEVDGDGDGDGDCDVGKREVRRRFDSSDEDRRRKRRYDSSSESESEREGRRRRRYDSSDEDQKHARNRKRKERKKWHDSDSDDCESSQEWENRHDKGGEHPSRNVNIRDAHHQRQRQREKKEKRKLDKEQSDELERIKNQPFACDIQDETLDWKLKDEIQEGDPMANSEKKVRHQNQIDLIYHQISMGWHL